MTKVYLNTANVNIVPTCEPRRLKSSDSDDENVTVLMVWKKFLLLSSSSYRTSARSSSWTPPANLSSPPIASGIYSKQKIQVLGRFRFKFFRLRGKRKPRSVF
ncbi:hypothetical protein PS2_001487 [Malus domestica]